MMMLVMLMVLMMTDKFQDRDNDFFLSSLFSSQRTL